MDAKTLLFCLTAVIVSVSGCPVGQEFITTFLTNYMKRSVKLELTITAHEKTATVNVWSPFFTQKVTVAKGSTTKINLPAEAELSDAGGPSNKIVRITSDNDITVVTSNMKSNTGDSSVILPTSNLGRKYVVFTPDPKVLSALVALVNGDKENKVEILPLFNMKVNEDNWETGKKVTLKLKPNEVYQFMSRQSFTGTVITSTLPLAVLVGDQCARLEGSCAHVYEQLLPVERLSDHYLVPAMLNRNKVDYAYVVAADDKTTVTIFGKQERAHTLHAGQKLEIPIRQGEPVIVKSNKKVMVMYFGSNPPYDEFLTNILPTSEMSNTWSVYPHETFENTAVIVSEVEGSTTISGVANWRPFPSDGRYVWAMKSLGKHKDPVSISGKALMVVYVFGGKQYDGYGTTGVCTSVFVPTPPPDPCDGITCGEKEECMRGDCVHTSEETCSALGDPHYRTFDGKRYDFQGTCTYTMAEVLKKEAGLVPFTVLAKNNHRGNKWVAYVRKVTVTVYNHTVTIRKKRARVEVDGEIVYLPVSLVGGKLQVVHRGRNAVLTTKFGLKVTYDWNMMLRITAPSSYFRTLGGLCGNYNGDHKDEWTSRSGSRLSSALKFAKSWKVQDGDLFCHDDCRGKCPSCSAAQKNKFSGVEYCGLITDTNSVFAKCISKVDPGMFFDNCVYDTCINNGIKSFLCDNIENYVDECMAADIKINGWRTLANCPMNCPANSHYEACGLACAASCAERNAPSMCQEPCVEGCQCNKGFVLSGEKCVPESSCGCTSEGRYYPPGQTFWADNTCTKKCKCTSGTLQCTVTKCKSSEVCSLRNGVRDCYPLSYGTCRGSGDPHYRSFDGKKFDFQGTCTYLLSKVISTTDPSLEPFEVQVQNENRGRNKAVAYTKTSLIKVYGHTIVLSSDNPGRVMLNNTFVNLPLALENGRLSIFRRGRAGVVKTDFGLEMQFDWRSYVSVTVPSTYHGVLGGLCGNFNGHGNDDMLTPNKTPAKNPTEFGESWKVKNDSRCKDTCEGKTCHKCDINSKQNEPFRKHCSILTDKTGPFKDCHSKEDPEQYYEDCVYDMCMYQGHSSALCNALSTYTSVCQEAKAGIDVWRTESLCPLACKANSHYEACPSSCSAMCPGTDEPEGCENTPCSEGCECDDAFVLSDEQCVPQEQCGCAHKGRYYQQDQVFFLDDQCKGRCVCGNDGRVQCQSDFSCGPNEVCRIQDGTEGCFPTTTATCSVSGTGHYHSFDNRDFSVPGNCVYKMAEVTQDNDGKRVPFSVVVHQESATNDPTVTRSVQIEVNDNNIVMLPGRIWEVTLDGIRVNLPLQLDDRKVQVYHNGHVIVLQTNFGLEVTYDTISMVRVDMPSSYKGVLLGLCGNYNDNPADDFVLPGGAQASSAEAFAEGWVVDQKGVKCQTGCGSQCPTPSPQGKELCDILKDKKSPFSKCHATVPPQEYFDKCVKDVSEQGGSKDVLCQHLQNYVAVCQESGGSVDSWRNKTLCPMTCPKNSQYELCADTCSTTCASLTTPQKCSHCQEGCECEDGFAFDGGECRPLGKCGCEVDGRYYKSGETVIDEDCQEKCTCVDGVFSCENTKCTVKQVCDIREGVRNCHQVDPCEAKNCREKETCVKNGSDVHCVAMSSSTCRIVGDPHYQSFDGKLFSYQGSCTYTLVQTTGLDKTLTPFSIVTKTEMESKHRGAYLKTVTVNMEGVQIVVVYGDPGKVQVDGSTSNLPVTLKSGRIRITQESYRGFIKTDFGVEITFDWGEVLHVTVPSSYYENLQGMCGTYNGDQADDFSMPNGSTIPSLKKWAEAWSLPEANSTCLHSCPGQCPVCTADDTSLYKQKKYCGEIGVESGAFAACHAKVLPEKLLEDCLYNMCIHKGDKEMLCKVMTNYAKICQLKGADVSKQWLQTLNC
ncbi:IgGFc-binding protein-like isoform X2 [Alosa pseudoharengus]|uniref:IgGFc-binding protein-like isoform X2 n=1 Tax=Alosa pseudoharengus TaxID=34774 RepID=UPI003F8C0B4A